MNISVILIFLLSPVLLASCPLGFPPEEACPFEIPSCALYTDEDGDALCDNPGPQPAASSEQSEESPSDTSETVSDSLDTETVSTSDSLPQETVNEIIQPDDSISLESAADSAIQTDESSVEDSSDQVSSIEDSVFVRNPAIIVSDEEGVLFCFNPRHDEATDHCDLVWEINGTITDSSIIIDSVTLEETDVPILTCPLLYSPEQACPEDSPFCAFFTDVDADLYCDNPVAIPDSSITAGENVTGRTNGPVLYLSGCPLGLTPQTACPSPDDPLCPNYKGFSGCTNPGGGGVRRTLILLIATAVLLPTATILKSHFRGRRKKDRHHRKISHITVQIISLVALGFLVQGCFCPLGVMQYALLPGGLIFLGGIGIAVLILPMIWSVFFDRIYCGWVCPFGALQDLLGKLHVPRPPKFSRKVHHILSGFRYLLAIMFFSFLLLVSSGQFESSVPTAFFCKYDPFHTIFSFFMVGSFIGAVATMCILIFFPRFFCKYLCFYGVILSFLGRIGLWKRFTRKHTSGDTNSMKQEE